MSDSLSNANLELVTNIESNILIVIDAGNSIKKGRATSIMLIVRNPMSEIRL